MQLLLTCSFVLQGLCAQSSAKSGISFL